MANMSYCRFRNTAEDLADCLEALEQNTPLSVEEHGAANRMFTAFLHFCRDRNFIKDFDAESVREYLDAVCGGNR